MWVPETLTLEVPQNIPQKKATSILQWQEKATHSQNPGCYEPKDPTDPLYHLRSGVGT